MSETSGCTSPQRIRISWTQLSNHEYCKQKAVLIRQHKKSPTDNVRNFFHGTVCDRVMRAWLSEPDPTPGAMPGMVEDFIDLCAEELRAEESGVVLWKSRTDRAEMTEFCKTLVTRLEPMLVKWVLPFDYEPEYRFQVPIRVPYLDGTPAEIELVGGIDVLVRLPAYGSASDLPRWQAYDLKATANPDYVRKTLAQGIFYDLAILAGFGRAPDEFTFLLPMVEDRQFVAAGVTDADRRSMLARIVAVAHDRWRGDDAPKLDAAGCSWCPVRGACRKFSPRAVGAFTPVRASR